MDTRTTIYDTLTAEGFVNVLGTYEYVKKQYQEVGKSPSMTWNRNQGVMVVVDITGAPWIKRSNEKEIADWVKAAEANPEHLFGDIQVEGHRFNQHGQVPHSNDGGRFVQDVLPTIAAYGFPADCRSRHRWYRHRDADPTAYPQARRT